MSDADHAASTAEFTLGPDDVLAQCPDCLDKWVINMPTKGETFGCPHCGVELEVVATDPLDLQLAPEEDEDWGE